MFNWAFENDGTGFNNHRLAYIKALVRFGLKDAGDEMMSNPCSEIALSSDQICNLRSVLPRGYISWQ